MTPERKRAPLRDEVLYPPNLITLGRIVVIAPFILWLARIETPKAATLAALLFILAGITDFLDGYLARRYQQITILGQFIDPLADKIIVSAVLIELCAMGRVPWWAVTLAIVRELGVTSLRGIASVEGLVIAASPGGKLKFTLQLVAVTALLLYYPYVIPIGPWTVRFDYHFVGLVFLYASLVVSLVSALDYGRKFVSVISKRD